MTVAFGAIGAKSAGATTPVAIPHPSSVGAEDLLIAGRAIWQSTATASNSSGWTPAGDQTGGTGTAADAHTTRARADWRQASGGETGNASFAQGGTVSGAMGIMARYTKDAAKTWDIASVSGDDATHAANRSVTASSSVDIEVGDIIVAIVPVDTDAALTITSPAITATGITFGTTNRRTSGAGVTTGNDGNIEWFDAEVTAGTGTQAPTLAFTTATSQCGPAVFLRLREVTPGNLLIDSSTPSLAAAANDPWVSASFTPPNDSVLLVGVCGDGFNAVPTHTPTSSGLTFQSRVKAGNANQAICEWFTAEVGSNGGTSRTVSVATNGASDVGACKVFVLTGQHPTGYVSAVNSDATGNTTNEINPDVFSPTLSDKEWVFVAAGSWIGGSLQLTSTDVYEEYNDADISYLIGRKSAVTDPAATVSFNLNQEGTGAALWTWAAIAIKPAPSEGGLSATVVQAAETDTATALVEKKLKTVAQGSETDTGSAITAGHRRTLGQPAESDTATALAERKLKILPQVTSAETATALTERKTRLLGQASTSDTATVVDLLTGLTLGQATEADSATSLVERKLRALLQASESDSGQVLGELKRKTVAQALETDSSTALAERKRKTVAQVVENDSADAVIRPGQVGKAFETDTAALLTERKLKTLLQASESDTSATLSRRKVYHLAQALESDTSAPIGEAKRKILGVPVSSDLAQALVRRKTGHLVGAVETSTARPVAGGGQSAILLQALEVDLAYTIIARRHTHPPNTGVTPRPNTGFTAPPFTGVTERP